ICRCTCSSYLPRLSCSLLAFCSNDPVPPSISSLSLHDALPIYPVGTPRGVDSSAHSRRRRPPRKEHNVPFEVVGDDDCALTSLRSEEHTSELQSRFDLVCRLLLQKNNLSEFRRLHFQAFASDRS